MGASPGRNFQDLKSSLTHFPQQPARPKRLTKTPTHLAAKQRRAHNPASDSPTDHTKQRARWQELARERQEEHQRRHRKELPTSEQQAAPDAGTMVGGMAMSAALSSVPGCLHKPPFHKSTDSSYVCRGNLQPSSLNLAATSLESLGSASNARA